MSRIIKVVISSSVILTLSINLTAQTKVQKSADIISYGTVSVQVGLDTLHSWNSPNRKLAFEKQIIRDGVTIGLSELIKKLVHEERPDGSDNKSFWSEHSAIAAASQGWNYSIGIPLTFGTASGRVVARKHYIWDVLVGSAIGSLTDRIVK